jgi:hypothetical protein
MNNNVPFLFNQAVPPSTPVHQWQPRSPMQQPQPEINDVPMHDAGSPLEMPVPSTAERVVATGALTRVFRSRQKQKGGTPRGGGRSRRRDEDDEDETDGDDVTETDGEGELIPATPRRRKGLQKSYSEPITTTANHNHHYTFNVPTPQLSHSEIPYVLLGYVVQIIDITISSQLFSTDICNSFLIYRLFWPYYTSCITFSVLFRKMWNKKWWKIHLVSTTISIWSNAAGQTSSRHFTGDQCLC